MAVITFPVEHTKRYKVQAAWDIYQAARWGGGMDDLPLINRTPEFERAFLDLVLDLPIL
jgi:hypothetical protein